MRQYTMDEGNTAVTNTEATVTESAPVEASTQETFEGGNTEATEKSEITQEGVEDTQGNSENMIPQSRLNDVISERNELREWREKTESEMQELREAAEYTKQLKQAMDLQNMDPAEKEAMTRREAAEKQLKDMGYVKGDDIKQLVNQELNGIKAQERFVTLMDNLSEKYNGSDGSPKFEPMDVAKFMDKEAEKGNRISDPERAYQLMHLDQIVESKAKKQNSSTFTERPGASTKASGDSRQADLQAAKESGNFSSFLNKYVSSPFDK